jgi:hypothetical protein
VPFQYSTEQPGRVEFLPEAEQLWQRVIDDEPLTRRLQEGVITAGDDVEGDSSSPSGGAGGSGSGGGSASPSPSAEEREAAGLCA